MVTIAFTGGGTGGHIYPGLAVADRLRASLDCRVVWIGSASGMDRSIVEAAGLEFVGVPSGKLRRYFSLRNALDVFKVLAGFLASRAALRRLRPALVFSKGGFVSVPPCAAAASLGIPVFTHESDYSPGLATRLNLRWAERVLTAYPDTAGFLAAPQRAKAVAVGNPVRAAFRSASAERGRRFLGLGEGDRMILVQGGSQGARQVNDLVAGALDSLASRYVVVHQTGAGMPAAGPASARYLPFEYLRGELPDVMAAAEIVVGRSGASAVWEAAACGKPMVLVPLAGSGTRGDQVENAAYFARLGAAVVLEGDGATPAGLAAAVVRLADDAAARNAMAAASASAAAADAAEAAALMIAQRVTGGEK